MKEFLENLQLKYKIVILAIMLIVIIVAFILLYKYYYVETDEQYNENEEQISMENDEFQFLTQEETSENQQPTSKISKTKEEKKILVHVVGEVNNPGVVELPEGARIIDAIKNAGGKTEDADLTKINLAYIIEDGVQIYVPKIGENMEEITYINEGAGEGILTETINQEESDKKIKININTADLEKLQNLPGVGASTAQKIIDYRKEHGNFKTIEEIKNVSGIGDSKFNTLKDYIVTK